MRAHLTDGGDTIQRNVTPKISGPCMSSFETSCHEFIVLPGLWGGGSFFPSNSQLRSRWELCSSRVSVIRRQGRGGNKKMSVMKYGI